MFKRILNLELLLAEKSHFLLGPRATGKTTLVEQTLPKAQVVDLLSARTFASLVRNPGMLGELILDPSKIVVIDEVQKLPAILDEVHRLIQKKKIRFLLTGSNARKLKHGGANLLAGRAREARLFPLVSSEIGIPQLDLCTLMNRGGIPDIYMSSSPDEELAAYVDTYLREEIKAEAVTRNIGAFVEFLDALAISNGQEMNYESFSSDLQVSPGTLKNYLQVLEDTLIGFRLPGYGKTKRRKAITRSKHYLFDLGVRRQLAREGEILPGSRAFGEAFEHFIILEVRAWNHYFRQREELAYWRSTSQMEVDLIVGDRAAIEIKATKQVSEKHLKGLRSLMEEGLIDHFIIVSQDEYRRVTEDGILIYPWREFLEALWAGDLL